MSERETNAHTKNQQSPGMVLKVQESSRTFRKFAQEERGQKTPLGMKRRASTQMQQR